MFPPHPPLPSPPPLISIDPGYKQSISLGLITIHIEQQRFLRAQPSLQPLWIS